MPVARNQAFTHDGQSSCVQREVERLHRQLIAAIKFHDTSNWVEILPIVLLSIRTAFKEDLNATAAKMVYGTGIRLPGEFLVPTARQTTSEYASRLKSGLKKRSRNRSIDMVRKTCSFSANSQDHPMYSCETTVRSPLQPPYNGPYRVLHRGKRTSR
jgi:hypothetical protein